MTVAQHVQTALAFLDHSDREFVDGDALQGSEKLWGAAYFSVARQFRNNFYRDFMEDEDIQDDRPKVHNFVNRIVEIVRESRNDEG
jgi:hypothetical protein